MSHLLGDEDPRHIQDCPACQNEQARCAGCRQSDYRPVIRENFEHQGIPYRSRVDIEDDKVTTHRRLEAEMAIKALSVLQVIRAQQKGREEAQKRKQEAKAQSTEVERLRKQHVDALYRERLVFPEREEKPFDFDDATLSRNRFYSGLGLKLFKAVTGEIFYLLQTSKSVDTWTDANRHAKTESGVWK